MKGHSFTACGKTRCFEGVQLYSLRKNCFCIGPASQHRGPASQHRDPAPSPKKNPPSPLRRRPGSPHSKKLEPVRNECPYESILDSPERNCLVPFWNCRVLAPRIFSSQPLLRTTSVVRQRAQNQMGFSPRGGLVERTPPRARPQLPAPSSQLPAPSSQLPAPSGLWKSCQAFGPVTEVHPADNTPLPPQNSWRDYSPNLVF
jgi:hypothetical protein